MNNRSLTLGQLESNLWDAANILRGSANAADFKTCVFPLLFFKRICNVRDEEYQAALAESDVNLKLAVSFCWCQRLVTFEDIWLATPAESGR